MAMQFITLMVCIGILVATAFNNQRLRRRIRELEGQLKEGTTGK